MWGSESYVVGSDYPTVHMFMTSYNQLERLSFQLNF